MSKTFVFSIVFATVIILLSIAGIITGNSYDLFSKLGLSTTDGSLDSAGLTLNDLFLSIFASGTGLLATVSAIGAIFIGYGVSQDIATGIRTGFATGFGVWITSDIGRLFTDLPNIIGSDFAALIIIMKTLLILGFIGFIVGLVQFATGAD